MGRKYNFEKFDLCYLEFDFNVCCWILKEISYRSVVWFKWVVGVKNFMLFF